jgi:transcriptional regulator with XRE-family HTH domain
MLRDVAHSGSPFSSELIRELSDPEFRREYMMDQVRSWIAFQIRAMREQRRWNQGDLAKESGKTQSVISRIEDPDYGKLSLQTGLEIAVAYDVPLLFQFVEWDEWLARMSDMSPSALRKRSFDANRLLEMRRRSNQSAAAAASDYIERPSGMLQNMGLGSATEEASSTFTTVNANEASESSRSYQRTTRGSAEERAAA